MVTADVSDTEHRPPEWAVMGYGCDTKILSHPKVDRGF